MKIETTCWLVPTLALAFALALIWSAVKDGGINGMVFLLFALLALLDLQFRQSLIVQLPKWLKENVGRQNSSKARRHLSRGRKRHTSKLL